MRPTILITNVMVSSIVLFVLIILFLSYSKNYEVYVVSPKNNIRLICNPSVQGERIDYQFILGLTVDC
jgi:hypothetical protein